MHLDSAYAVHHPLGFLVWSHVLHLDVLSRLELQLLDGQFVYAAFYTSIS